MTNDNYISNLMDCYFGSLLSVIVILVNLERNVIYTLKKHESGSYIKFNLTFKKY